MKKITRMRSLALLLFAGMMSTAMADNTVSVEATVSGTTTTTEYATLDAAFTTIGSTAGTYVVTLSGDQQVTTKCNSTADNYCLIPICASQVVTIKPKSGMSITIKRKQVTNCHTFTVEKSGTLTIDGSDGTLIFDGDNINDNYSFVNASAGIANIMNVTFVNCQCNSFSGGAVKCGGVVTIKNTLFKDCKNNNSPQIGGAIFACNGTTLSGSIKFDNCMPNDICLEKANGVDVTTDFTTTNGVKIGWNAPSSLGTTTYNLVKGKNTTTATTSNFSINSCNLGNLYCLQANGNNLKVAEGITASISSAGWATLELPFDYNASVTGLTAYTCDAVNSTDKTKLTLTEAATLSGHTPYIIKGDAGFYPIYGTVAVQSSPAKVGYLQGVETSTTLTSSTDPYYYVLQNQNNAVAFYKVTTNDIVIPPYHCYLSIPASDISGAASFSLDDNFATGITPAIGTSAQNQTTDVYTISGVRMKAHVTCANALEGLPAGFYVVNGKKYMVK